MNLRIQCISLSYLQTVILIMCVVHPEGLFECNTAAKNIMRWMLLPLFRYYKLHVGHQIINIKLMLENHTPLFAQFSYGDRKKHNLYWTTLTAAIKKSCKCVNISGPPTVSYSLCSLEACVPWKSTVDLPFKKNSSWKRETLYKQGLIQDWTAAAFSTKYSSSFAITMCSISAQSTYRW